VEQAVTAAEGGTVMVGASATLAIPANALAADTTITATADAPPSSLPDVQKVKGQYFDFGPSGTTFDPPATLTLPGNGTPPANATAVISTFDGTTWTDLPTTVSGGSVTAPVSHFSGFAVRWVAVGAVDCGGIPATLSGGDIVGTWKLKGGCLTPEPVGDCTDSGSGVTYEMTSATGSAVFNSNLTYTVNLPYAVTGTVHATPACLQVLGANSCTGDVQSGLRGSEDSHFPALWANASCTGSASSSGCTCTGSTTGSIASNESGTYTVATTSFTTTKSGSAAGNPVPYSVIGTTLWVQTDDGEYIVFDKQ
jgi:hypothetical protein